MPELPEVQTIVSELDRKLKNKKIRSVTVNAPKMVSVGPLTVSNKRQVSRAEVARFMKLLRGQKIAAVKRRAKLLIFKFFSPLSMLVHLKMTGQFIFENKQLRAKTNGKYRMFNKLTAPLVQLPGKHTHVVFSFADGSRLYFNDIRKFGYLKIVRDYEIGQVRELREFGLEPLSKDFTLPAFFAAAKNASARRKVKEWLMDAKIVAGIGNIYSDEILFHAKLKPARLVSRIKNHELRSIYKYIKVVLKKAIQAKGSSVGDFVRTDGGWGQMGKYHFVYGRGGEKCKVCGAVIKSMKLGGRTSSFCPRCQK